MTDKPVQKRIPEPLRSKLAEGIRAVVAKDYKAAARFAKEIVETEGGMALMDRDTPYAEDITAIRIAEGQIHEPQ